MRGGQHAGLAPGQNGSVVVHAPLEDEEELLLEDTAPLLLELEEEDEVVGTHVPPITESGA